MLSEGDVYDYARGICFKTGPPGKVGVEAEWLVTDPARPRERVPLPQLRGILASADPPHGSTVTFEPGGQLELSSRPAPGPAAAHRALAADLAYVADLLEPHGLRLEGRGLDTRRPPDRQLAHPRYAAMERFFDARGPDGRWMMCNTASVQVNLDIGADDADAAQRWTLLNRLGPVLLAAFANSPARHGRFAGWRSARWGNWLHIDSSRTLPVEGSDPPTAWARYAMAARLVTIRAPAGPWLVDPGMAFGDWLARGRPRPPDQEDLAFHLTTLFPPVRPLGRLELRMIDAQTPHWWPAAMGAACALVDEATARATAEEAIDRLHTSAHPGDLWNRAARRGLADTDLAACARTCLAAAVDALPRLGARDLGLLVQEFADRYTERRRCPADDALAPEGAST